MPVIAMKVTKAEQHPNADRLRLYSFENANGESLQIVANLSNVYEVGDVAAIATIGTILEDNTEIKQANIRKVDSFGMALGKVDAEVGTDLSEQFKSK